ncbi:MAG: radical SAM protein [Desulfovibrionaceae bacterium]|nr:radical SAM protein [Desulfovibrionaceae bacterium]
MKELLKRREAIDHLRHHGRFDPNLVIYEWLRDSGSPEKAERFLRYRKLWEATRASGATPDIPLFVTFGFNDSCNLSCVHCYRQYNPDRDSKRVLTMDEVRRLVDECKEIGVPSLGLGTESELFLHKDVRAILEYIGQKDFEDVWVYTNGQGLDDEMARLVLDAGVTRLSVSIDALSPDQYRTVRGGDFHRLMANVFNFLARRAERGSRLPVFRVTYVLYNLTAPERDAFVDFWSRIAEEVDVQPLIDIKNIDELRYDSIDKVHCRYPDSMLYIKWDGSYRPCCSEFSKHLSAGNIREQGILETWKGPFMEDLRRQLAGGRDLNRACLNCLRSLRSDQDYAPPKKRRPR